MCQEKNEEPVAMQELPTICLWQTPDTDSQFRDCEQSRTESERIRSERLHHFQWDLKKYDF